MKTINLEVVSPPRCGSTFVYNFFKLIEGKNNNFYQFNQVLHNHPPLLDGTFNKRFLHNFNFETFYIFCVRHPISKFISHVIFEYSECSEINFNLIDKKYFETMINYTIRDFKFINACNNYHTFNTSLIRYEDWFGNNEYLYNFLDSTFGISFPDIDKLQFNSNFDVNYIQSSTCSSPALNFNYKHVSKGLGDNHKNLKYVPNYLRKILNYKFREIYKLFDYEPVNFNEIEYINQY